MSNPHRRILVTGGDGFIGKYLVSLLRKNCYEVTVWDLKSGTDIMKQKCIRGKYDAMVHLAAQVEILGVDPIPELDLNVKGTLLMLELCRKYDIPKFVFASSVSVYGNTIRAKETSAMRPIWSYGASKVAGEAYCKQYTELYDIKTPIIRPVSIIGVNEWYGRVVTLSLARIRNNEPILQFGSGTNTRDLMDVRDCASIFYLTTVKPIKTIILNCGSDNAYCIKDILNFLSRISHTKIKFINPRVGELGRKPHELRNMRVNMSKTKRILHFALEYTLSETLENEYYWIMNMNEQEFKKWSRIPRY